MRHINGCDRGHSVVTGSPKTFGCGHRATEGFLVWLRGHQTLSGVVKGFLVWPQGHESFSAGHRAVLCRAESKNFARTSNGAASA